MQEGRLLFEARGFRTIFQLVAESLLALVFIMSLGASMSVAYITYGLPLLLASGYMLYKLRTGWHRKKIAVYDNGLRIGREFIDWSRVGSINYSSKTEVGLIVGSTPLTYEEVFEVDVSLVDGGSKSFRLKARDFQRFAKALESIGRMVT